MASTFVVAQIGDRVRYLSGTMSSAARKGQIGIITAVFSDRANGLLRADIMFDDGLERGVSLALMELA